MQPLAWNNDRENGDAYSPNPAREYFAPLVPPSNDIHAISASAGTEPSDPSLPDRGGYNYQITIPAGGGIIQVYNAAPDSDNGTAGPNRCDNIQGYPPASCSAGGSYYYREGSNGVNFADPTTFLSVKYTIFRVTNTFGPGR